MKYPEEFENLINTTKENLIGWGNPNAKILIIACEPSIPEKNIAQIECEIKKNKIMWQRNLKCQFQLDKWLHSFRLEDNPCEDLSECPNYNPFHPYYKQRNTPFPKQGGTSRSWWYYQKIIERIIGCSEKTDYIDFFQNCFCTDLSAANAKNYNQRDLIKTKASIDNRVKNFFPHAFFQHFNIVIMSCGHYVKDFNIKPYEIFDIPFINQIKDKNDRWINYHCKNGNTPRLLLHTCHLTAKGLHVNDYIDEIVHICESFLNENKL